MTAKYALRFASLGYLALLLVAPLGLIFWRTFEHGVGPAWAAVTTPDALHALKVTLVLTAIAVPANTIFGVLCALAIVRHRYPGAGIVNAVVDLPLALSPVVVGLALLVLYVRGRVDDSPRAGRVRRGERRLRTPRRADGVAHSLRPGPLPVVRQHRRLCRCRTPRSPGPGDPPPDDAAEAQRGSPMIAARGVVKRFGDFTALDGVSVDVPTGSLTALLGPSGSGKSTLLRVIAGLEQPDAGEISLDGEDVTGLRPQSRGVGFVFQHYAAFKHMTVWDNVAFGLTIRRRPRSEIKQRVTELLELVQLAGLAKRYPAQLSGGQRQRMGLARALAVDPKVLLLDEPFGALDARVRTELRAWLRRLHEETHTTTVFVTHDQEEAMEVADRVVVMNKGRVEQVAGPRELYDAPANEFVMSFVGQANRLGDAWVRPHDFELVLEPNGTTREAQVERVVHLGFEVRVELQRDDGEPFAVQLTRDQAETLELEPGQIVFVRPTRERRFETVSDA